MLCYKMMTYVVHVSAINTVGDDLDAAKSAVENLHGQGNGRDTEVAATGNIGKTGEE